MCSLLVLSCTIRRTIAADPRATVLDPTAVFPWTPSARVMLLLTFTNPTSIRMYCVVVFCLQSSGVHSPQCRMAVQLDTVWRMQTLRIPTFWEVALCRWVTVPVFWKASSSPVTALDNLETSGTTHLRHSATYQRIWILRNTVVRTTNHPDVCSSSQKLCRILRSLGVHYHVDNSPPDFPLLSQINPVQDLPFYLMFLQSCYLCLCLPSGLFPQVFPPNITFISPLSHT